MPGQEQTTTVARDDLDDLFDYGHDPAEDEDLFKPTSTNFSAPASKTQSAKKTDDVLGIQDEIQVTKKRIPIPKLDESRLLSQNGIPKLRRISKDRLKFKGKGHEFSDVACMLNLYQLWLDDLYPRAKFADGLAMIEKLGHSKRIQVMRKAWIDEGKPRDKYDIDFRQPEASKLTTTEQNGTGPEQVLTKPTNSAEDETSKTTKPKEASGDAEERDLFLSDDEAPPNARDPFDDDLDDLDALLAEEADRPRTRPTSAQPQETPDDFADDLEAMEGMEGLW